MLKETKTLYAHEEGLKVWCKKTDAGYILIDESGRQVSKKAYAGQGGCVALAYDYTAKKAKSGLIYQGSWASAKKTEATKKAKKEATKKAKTEAAKKTKKVIAKKKVIKVKAVARGKKQPTKKYTGKEYLQEAVELISKSKCTGLVLPKLVKKNGRPYSKKAALLVEVERRLLQLPEPLTELKPIQAWNELGYDVIEGSKALYPAPNAKFGMFDRQQVVKRGEPRVIERKANSYKPEPAVEEPVKPVEEQPKKTVEQPAKSVVEESIQLLNEQMLEAVKNRDFETASKIADVIDRLTK